MSDDDVDFFAVQPNAVVKVPTPVDSKISIPAQDESLLSLAAAQAGVQITNADQLKVLNDFMDNAKYGHHSALPMKCQGAQCPFFGICPLEKAKLTLPVGKICPVEKAVMAQWVSNTMHALGIDPKNAEDAVDISMVFELASLEMIRYRAAWHLAADPALVEEKIVAFSPQGEPIYDEKPKMSLLILEKYAKVIGKLRDQLLATRRSQAQVGKISNDVSIRAANMQEKARKLAEKRRSMTVDDADFEIKKDEPAS